MNKERAYNDLIEECESLVGSICDAYSSIEIDTRAVIIDDGAAEDIIDETVESMLDRVESMSQFSEYDSLMQRNGTSLMEIMMDGVARHNAAVKDAYDRFMSFEIPDKPELSRQLMNEIVYYIDDICERDPDRFNAKIATDVMLVDCETTKVVSNLIAAFVDGDQGLRQIAAYDLEWTLIYGHDTYLSHISGDDVETFKKLIPEDECKDGHLFIGFGNQLVTFDELFDHIDDLAHPAYIEEELSSIFNRYRRRVHEDE
jgi:hypothetical protein